MAFSIFLSVVQTSPKPILKHFYHFENPYPTAVMQHFPPLSQPQTTTNLLYVFFFYFNVCLFGCAGSQLRLAGFLVVACELLVAASCGIQFPDWGSNPGSLHWECGVLTPAPLLYIFINLPIPDMSYKWIHTIYGLLCLASVTQHIFKFHPCRPMYQYFISFYCQV